MRFAVYSKGGLGLAFWDRLQAEGHDVLVYIEETEQSNVGDGIVPKTRNFLHFCSWGHGGVFFFDDSRAGAQADLLRKRGELVVGAGGFCDKLETKRDWGQALVESVGIATPKTYEFKSIDQAKTIAAKHDGGLYFKSNKYLGINATYGADDAEHMIRYLDFVARKNGNSITGILQEKIDGVAISTARWWNGRAWVGPVEGSIEHKKLMDGDVGSATGCAMNIVWHYDDEQPEIARRLNWEGLTDLWRKYEAPPGIYDINAIVAGETAYFLEWTPRWGYDSETTGQHLIADYGRLLHGVASGSSLEGVFEMGNLAASVHLSVQPFPWEDASKSDKRTCIGHPVWGEDGLWEGHFVAGSLSRPDGKNLEVADAFGSVGLASAVGETIDGAYEEVYAFIKDDLSVPDLQYRSDAAKTISADVERLRDYGIEVL